MQVKSKQSQKSKNIQRGITPEFKRWVKKFMDEHDDALRELAKR